MNRAKRFHSRILKTFFSFFYFVFISHPFGCFFVVQEESQISESVKDEVRKGRPTKMKRRIKHKHGMPHTYTKRERSEREREGGTVIKVERLRCERKQTQTQTHTHTKAMRKDFFSGFSIFAKDETVFFSYSNLIRNKFDIFVFAEISRNKYGTKSGTRIC